MRTLNTLLKRGFLWIRVMTLNTHHTVTTDPTKQGHNATLKLIPIKLTNTNNPTLKTHTVHSHATHLSNIHAPKQPHLTLNTPPLRTDPHTFTHSGPMFGDTGCGVGWSEGVTPACPRCLIFRLWPTWREELACVMKCKGFFFEWVNGHCLFSLLLMALSEGGKSGVKRETYDDQVFFPSSWECFTL